MNDKYEREPAEDDSDGTVELPPRFDEDGNRVSEDHLTSTINNLLGQAGFTSFLNNLGGGSRHDDDEGRSGRRRHRR